MLYNDETIKYINETIKSYVPKTKYPQKIYESVNYSLFGGGKRVRPFLMIASNELAEGDKAFIEPLFSALEMIHTYSLIHDDLPCMDDDELRRGRPTNHMVYGYSTAVLAGDALLNLAYETLFGAYDSVKEKEKYIEACSLIATGAGINGMVGGQVADMGYDETNSDENALKYIYANKTGALIRASVLCGALSGAVSNEEYKLLESFSLDLGLLFQLTDDVLDMENGKPEEGKMTYASVYGYDYTIELIDKICHRIRETLACFGERKNVLLDFSEKIAVRRK